MFDGANHFANFNAMIEIFTILLKQFNMQILKGNLIIMFTFVSGMFFLNYGHFGHNLNWSTLKSTKIPRMKLLLWFVFLYFCWFQDRNYLYLCRYWKWDHFDSWFGRWLLEKKGLCSITNCKTLVYSFVCNM